MGIGLTVPLGTEGVFTGEWQDGFQKISRKHPQFDTIPYPSSGCTGASLLPGKFCADAFTFTSHEEHLSKPREQISSRYRSVQRHWCVPALIISFSYLLTVELTTSINFVTKAFSHSSVSKRDQWHTPKSWSLQWANPGDLSLSSAHNYLDSNWGTSPGQHKGCSAVESLPSVRQQSRHLCISCRLADPAVATTHAWH